MTLHWWMHWFWITCHFLSCILLTHSMPLTPLSTLSSELNTEQTRPLRRPVKSIDQTTMPKSQVSISIPFPDTSDISDISVGESLSQLYKTKTSINPEKILCLNYGQNSTSVLNSTTALKNETYLLCNRKQFNHNSSNQQFENDNSSIPISNDNETEMTTENDNIDYDNVTTDSDIIKNVVINNTITSLTVTKELVSSKISENENDSMNSTTLTAVSITGIAFGVLVFAAFVGVTSFILYRRRYLNKPQTLNDKCSNPDSSGYIDDSTMRENSEEMYSLDNDSFLNSLEAMTIQNYWTDSVKHTKL